MDFEELMIANSISQATLDMLKEKYETLETVEEFIHEKVLSLFFVYIIVGGMPDPVKTYVSTKDIRDVDKVQRDIITLFKVDFTQYEQEDKELKFDRYENSFLWLKDAGVVLPVYNTDAPIITLLASKSSNVFRLFSNDIGLLTSAYPAETKIELINKN